MSQLIFTRDMPTKGENVIPINTAQFEPLEGVSRVYTIATEGVDNTERVRPKGHFADVTFYEGPDDNPLTRKDKRLSGVQLQEGANSDIEFSLSDGVTVSGNLRHEAVER